MPSRFWSRLARRFFALTTRGSFALVVLLSEPAIAQSTGILDYYLRHYDVASSALEPGDHDGDGVLNEDDAFPRNPHEWLDTDGDRIGNNADSDDDSDGMPDAFEQLYSFNPLVNDGNLDNDSDGATNAQEYQLGTNPRNMLSCTGSACVLSQAPAPAAITYPAVDSVSDSVGTMVGNFSVSKAGSAEYTIPIYTPEGTASVTPKLALQYRTGSGNGLLGQDWALGELSVITRCPQTHSLDGQAKAVDMSVEDRFCLDGERLVLVNPTDVYGANGVEYRTEVDGFDKIVSYTSIADNGPDYFRVWHKDGSVGEYGHTSDSLLRSASTSPAKNILWAQNRVEPANSYATAFKNPVIYKYEPPVDSSNNDIRIKSIEYAFANVANSPNVVVEFVYSNRLDIKYTAKQRAFVRHDRRLQAIAVKSKVGGTLTTVRSYTLSYLNDEKGLSSRLVTVKECGAGNCYPDTQFTWSNVGGDFSVSAGTAISGLSGLQLDSSQDQELPRYAPADFNGDGKADLIWLEPDENDFRFKASPSNGTTLLAPTTESAAAHAIDAWTIVDFDQDGYPDILFTSQGSLYMYRNMLANGLRSYDSAAVQLIADLDMETEPELDGSWFDPKGVFADINADGLIDVLYNKAIFYMEKDNSQANGPYKFGVPQIITLGDSNTAGTLNNTIKSQMTHGLHGFGTYQTVDLDSAQISGDFNGDGLRDFLAKVRYQKEGVDGWDAYSVMLLNDGAGGLKYFAIPFESSTSSPETTENRKAYIVDLNNDGLSDVAYSSYDQSRWEYALSNGSSLMTGAGAGFFINKVSLSSYHVDGIGMYDINQDSLPDFVYREYLGNANTAPSDDRVLVIFNNGYAPVSSEVSGVSGWGPTALVDGIEDEHLGNTLFMDINGDGVLDYVDLATGVQLGNNPAGSGLNKITKITNGLGEEINITYAPLTNPDVYTREFDASTLALGEPVFDVFGPAMVVSNVSTSAPVEGNPNYQRSTSYRYQGLKYQPAGRGSLGFHVTQITDDETGTTLTNTFRQDFPFIGMPALVQTYVRGQSTPLEETAYSYAKLSHIHGANAAPYLPVFTGSVHTQRVAASDASSSSPAVTISGVLATTTTSASNYDAYGNAGVVTTTVAGDGDTHTTTTTSTWANDTTNWRLGKLTQLVETKQQGSSSITRTTSYTYNSQSGLLTSEVREPQGGSAIKLTTSYDYDTFGNVAKTTIASAAGSRYERVIYDATGRYVDKTYNGLEQLVSSVTQRNAYGQPEVINGLNGKVQYLRYSSLGRQIFNASNDGGAVTTQYRLCTAVECPVGAVYRVQTTGTDGSLVNSYADKLGRELRSEIKSFSGTLSITDTWYDGAGRVKRQSLPYFAGASTYWNTNTYDDLGRVIKVVDGNNGTSANHYSYGVGGAQLLSTNPLNQTKAMLTDGLGQLVSVADNLGGTLHYSYDAAGNLTQVNANGAVTTLVYDLLGRRTSMNDPDQGAWSYQYNAFGDLTQQSDATGAKTSLVYDVLARLTQREDKKTNQNIEGDTRWTYGTSANDAGLLAAEEDLVSGYIKLHAYDNHGRLSQTITSLGQDGVDGDYTEYLTYDQYGRPFQQIDATGHGVQYVYNASGYRQKVVEATETAHVYQTVTSVDAWGQITGESLVNEQFQVAHSFDPTTGLPTNILASTSYGVPRTLVDIDLTFDQVGQLVSRTRQVQAQGSLPSKTLTETFTYDGLNRLTSAAASGQSTQTLTYDLTGNILNKSDVGNYTYGANNAGPHAITSAGSATYIYDAVGNMTSGDGRLVKYNTFRKPTEISKGSASVSFDYGPDRQHYKRVDVNGSEVTTTLSVSNVEFIKEGNNPLITKRYIGGVVIVTDKPGLHEEHALLTDHLGSTVALAKANTIDLEQLDYDAFGKRRSLWTLNELLQAESISLNKLTTTGFTGHEMLDGVGLIHMKGRVYSPHLGRFLSADPYITQPANSQDFNRYSYVYNNPLTLTDPSGFVETIEEINITGHKPDFVRGGGYGDYGSTTSWDWTSSYDDGASLMQGDAIFGDDSDNFATTNDLIKAGLLTYKINPNGTVSFHLVKENHTVQSNPTPNITINNGVVAEADSDGGGGGSGGGMGSSSGYAGGDQTYRSEEDAAVGILTIIADNPRFDDNGRLVEQGGDITPSGDEYVVDSIEVGSDTRVIMQRWENAVAMFHFHPPSGNPVQDQRNIRLSMQDRLSMVEPGKPTIPWYLAAPDGSIRKFEVGGDTDGEMIRPPGTLTYK